MTQLAALSEAEIERRFHITGRQPVSFMLAGFAREGDQFSVHFGNDKFLTTLLAVDPEKHGMIFDCSGSSELNRHLLQNERLIFVGRPGGIHVQFATRRAWEVMFGGGKAFATHLPAFIVRLQRREFFRIETPRVQPLEFFGRLADGSLLKLPVHDISVAGLAILATDPPPPIEIGQEIGPCHLALPGDGQELFFSAIVRHLTASESRSGARKWRIGLQFGKLPSADEMRVQRYIARLERERHELI